MERFTTKTASLKATKATFNKALSKSLDSENIKLRGQNLEDIFGKKYNFDDGKDEVRPHEIVGNIVKVDDEKNEIFIGSQYVPDSSRYAYENREHFNFERDEDGNPIKNENCISYIEFDKGYSYDVDYTHGELNGIADAFRLNLSDVKDTTSLTTIWNEEDGLYEYKSPVCDIYYDFRNMLSSGEIPPAFEFYTTFSYAIHDGMGNFEHLDTLNFIEYVETDLSNLTNGIFAFSHMEMGDYLNPFYFCSNLSNLQYGDGMFQYQDIQEFIVTSLHSLCSAVGMFSYTKGLNKFNIDCPNLYVGDYMFEMNTDLEEFTSDLSSLLWGYNMFTGCSSLKKFYSAIPKLEDGEDMFSGCILDDKSLYIIATSIPDLSETGYDGKIITLGLDCTEEELESFATRKYFSSVEELTQMFEKKGWVANIQYNGTGASTYGFRRTESASAPKVYVKKTEVIIDKSNRDKKNHRKVYNYRDAEGKKYHVSWCHNTKNVDDYTEFNSLEEAIETWNLTKAEFKTIKK